MTTPDRKYLSEFALGLCSARWLMCPADQLTADGEMPEQAAEISSCCHLYLICKRPASAFDPTSLEYDGREVSGTLVYKVAGKVSKYPFRFGYLLDDNETAIEVAPYPHREIWAIGADGDWTRQWPASWISGGNPALRKFEVLYVGQAYAEGRRTAFDRLKSHSTLQKILADTHYKYPDDEVSVFTFEYAPYRLFTVFDGIDQKAIRDERDTSRLESIFETPLTMHQQICLAEAGLIRYFRPPYNEIYKDSFPASDQKILNSCLELDFSALVVEIDTEEQAIQLFSAAVAPSEHHMAQFDLIDSTVRRSFFTFVGRDGRAGTMPNVIARTR